MPDVAGSGVGVLAGGRLGDLVSSKKLPARLNAARHACTRQLEVGAVRGANSENWPILVGQKGAVYLARLAVGGIREPHWHPSAWEINVILAGRSRWVFVGPNGTQDVFEADKGDVIFAPQGHYHYFENASATEELVALIVFNSDAAEPKDDIGTGQSLTAISNDVLSAVLGVPVSVFEQIPTVPGRIVIVKRPDGQTGARQSGS
jgi:oxalate decarboxylase